MKKIFPLFMVIIVLAVIVVINLIVAQIPTSKTQIDLSTQKMYSITDETKTALKDLDQDVTLYYIVQKGSEDDTTEKLLEHYDELSDHIKVETKDPDLYPKFTSLCPITGQPDFAAITISYVPDVKMVESKSLKLYLFSFRNHGDFHEDCVNIIMKDLIRLMEPKYIEVWGKFTPRGGISIDPYCNYGKPGTRWEQVAWERLSSHDLYPEKVDNR